MELQKLNKILKNLQSPDKSVLKFIKKEEIHMGVSGYEDSYGGYDGEGVQGESDNYCNIYEIIDEDDLFLRVEMTTDSYGYNDSVIGVTFVKPTTKRVVEFEII